MYNYLIIIWRSLLLKECCGKGANGCCAEMNQNGTSNGTSQNGVLNVSCDCYLQN